MKIIAAVARGADVPFALEEVELDDIRADEVLVKVAAVGLCHTDLYVKSIFPADPGLVLGHEGAGVVEQIGDDVSGVSVGDKVVMSIASCGVCSACDSEAPGYCDQFQVLNFAGLRADFTPSMNGGEHGPVNGSFFGQSSFATHALIQARNVVVVPDDTDLTVAAPMGCSFQTGAGAVLNVLQPSPESRLVVYGVGGVGMAAVMAAVASGIGTIVAVDVDDERRALALEFGATAVVDGGATDLAEQLTAATGGGATHALDTTGIPAVISGAVAALATRGTLVVVGTGDSDVTINITDVMSVGKTIRGSIEGDSVPSEIIPKLLAWHSEGRFDVEKLIRTYPLADINTAVDDMHNGKSVKPVLLVNQ